MNINQEAGKITAKKHYSILKQIAEKYSQGENLINYLNQLDNTSTNSKEAIMISYDFQSGTYVKNYDENPTLSHKYSSQIAEAINILGSFDSIMEAGVGEATTFQHVTELCKITDNNCYGFDISWSRIKVAQEFLQRYSHKGHHIFVADLFSIPLCDNAIDVVYTSHSIEPNGGFEKTILEELYRVAKKYLVLFEPDYDLANNEAKARMNQHGYIKNLAATAKSLGYEVIEHSLVKYTRNPLNPTSKIVIKKSEKESVVNKEIFQCPVTKTSLIDCGEIYFSPEAYLMYPVIQNIPCLLGSQAILGSKYKPL